MDFALAAAADPANPPNSFSKPNCLIFSLVSPFPLLFKISWNSFLLIEF
jgi:hypothetical protein